MPQRPFAVVLLLVAALLAPALPAKTKPAQPAPLPELSLVLLEPDFYVGENFPDLKTFTEPTKPILEISRDALAAEKNPSKLLVQVTLRKIGEPTIELAGAPALRPEFAKALHAKLEALPLPHPPLCDIHFRIQSTAKGEDPFVGAAAFTPKMPLPANVASDYFVTADLAQQSTLLRDWARNEALPLLAHQAAGVDPKFAGVIATGRMVQQLDLGQRLDVEQLTYRNPDFWRGVMEMTPGNQLVGALPVLLFVANGEFAKAGHLYSVIRPNALDGSSAGILLAQLGTMLGPFTHQHNDRIQKGIKLHEQGRYHEAIKVYRDILADYPGSAWAWYELFFSTLFRDKLMPPSSQADLDRRWGAASAEIYKLDPLYDVQMTGSRGKDFGSMIDRLTLRSMEEKPPADPVQVFATKAEIALHLGRYGEAALSYWQLLFRKSDVHVQLVADKQPRTLTTEQLIARYLYCLEQLGAPEWKSQFKGDFAEAFKQLDAELAAHRKQ
jgi:hypothetical protein